MKPGGENEQGNEAQEAQLLGAGWGPCPPWHGDSPAPRGVPNPQHPATGGPWGKPESPAPFGDADPSKHPAPSPFWARLQVGPPQDVPPKGSSATQAPATRCGAQLAPANPPGWAVGDGSQQAWDRLWGGTGGARTLWGRGVPPGGPGVQLAGGGSGRGGGPRGPLQVTQRHGAPMELSAGTPGGFTNPMCRCWGTAPTLKLLLDHFPDVSNAGTPATAGPGFADPAGPFQPPCPLLSHRALSFPHDPNRIGEAGPAGELATPSLQLRGWVVCRGRGPSPRCPHGVPTTRAARGRCPHGSCVGRIRPQSRAGHGELPPSLLDPSPCAHPRAPVLIPVTFAISRLLVTQLRPAPAPASPAAHSAAWGTGKKKGGDGTQPPIFLLLSLLFPK